MARIHAHVDIPNRAHGEITLYQEPEDDIVLLGAMQQDAVIQWQQLKNLPAAGDSYHGALLVIRGAAQRMLRRCDRLITQAETRTDRTQRKVSGKAHD